MANKSTRVLRIQKLIVGLVGLVVVAVIGYALIMIEDAAPDGEFVEGTHYTAIEQPRRVRSGTTEVIEFFSYGCIYCYNFDPLLEAWLGEQNDSVKFLRNPSVVGEQSRLLGHTYYTMQTLGLLDDNHARLFAEIHKLGKVFSSAEELADWFEAKGVDRAEFLATFDSPNVQRRVAGADALARQLRIIGIPSMVVNGKYLVSMNTQIGPKRMLEVVDFLVARDQQPSQPE